MDAQKPLIFGFSMILLVLLFLFIRDLNIITVAEKTYIYIGLSMIVPATLIYAIRD